MSENAKLDEFIRATQKFVPENARLAVCQFRGDPYANIQGKWNVRVLNEKVVDEGANLYGCVSCFNFQPGVRFDRKTDNFVGGVLLMIDDLGSGPGSKFPLSTIDALKPTALIETSPDNFQAVYMFDRLVTDKSKFNALIDAFVHAQFLGQDTGMKGVNRVFRLPGGVNGKDKYKRDGKPFRVNMKDWNPELRYSIAEIASAFNLKPIEVARVHRRLPSEEAMARASMFTSIYAAIKNFGMITGEGGAGKNWVHITCPWVGNHTAGVDNGAALTAPSEENHWYGGFKCWHGSCEGKDWGDLVDSLEPIFNEICEQANERGGKE
jgi:hypothetical protein